MVEKNTKSNDMHAVWHQVNDPVHKIMSFTTEEKNLIKPFLDNPIFQRLRGIKQMGLANLVFPGAVHSRFSHCLGACHLASFIIYLVGKKNEDRLTINEKAFILSALLHDIGHGPYSHAFEKLYVKEDNSKILTHEDWSLKIIDDLFLNDENLLDEYADKNKLKKRAAKKELKDIHGRIKQIFDEKIEKDFYSSLISSQLDVDRMDYLLRDSYYCGVEYGTYDIDWLLHSIRKVDIRGSSKLTITPKGIGVVENLLLARYLMRRHVCLNKKVQSAEYLIMEFIKEIYGNDKVRNYLKSTLWNNNFINFLENLHNIISKSKDADKVKESILDFCIDDYKVIVDADVYMLMRQINDLNIPKAAKSSLKEISNRLLNRKLPAAFILRKEKKFISSQIIEEFKDKNKKYQSWQISLNSPIVPECYESKKDPILVSCKFTANHKKINDLFELKDSDHVVSDLEQGSKIISRISNISDEICFLFIDIEIENDKKIKNLLDKLKFAGCVTYYR